MKKMMATAVALVLACSLSTMAFAADGKETLNGLGDQSITVTAKHNDATSSTPVYSVDITWEDMTFTYNESGTRTWDPDTHTYTDNTTAGWDKISADVTVTNHSDAAVKVSFGYQEVETTGITGVMSQDSFTLAAGVENDYAGADSDTSVFSITGTPNDTVTPEGVTMGTITVTVAAA